MDLILVLLPLALLLAALAVAVFVWAVHRGQFDDLETPALRILFEDEPAKKEEPPADEPEARPGDEAKGDP